MKKKLKIALIVVVVAVAAMCISFFAYNTGVLAKDPKISKAEAKAIAEEYTDGEAISIHIEKEGFTSVYEVVVVNVTGQWEVEIDGEDGTVLEVEEDDGPEEREDDDDDDDDMA